MAVIAAPTPARSPPWILSRSTDLLLFIGTPALIIPLMALIRPNVSLEEIALYVVAFGATGHHLPGMMRAYGDRQLFRRFRTRFIVAPLFLLTVSILFAWWQLAGLLLFALLWGIWHGMMQLYGFARIYDAKVGSLTVVTARLDLLLCGAWFGAGVVNSPARVTGLLESFYAAGGPLASPAVVHAFQNAWNIGTLAISVAFLLNLVRQSATAQPPNPLKLLLMSSSFAFWWYAMVAINNVVIGLALWEIFHDVQYLALVWVFNRKRVDQDPEVGSFTALLFRRSWAMVGVYLGLIVGYGALDLLPGTIDDDRLSMLLLALLTTSSFLHVYYDGFIWKVRERSTRQGLGVDGGRDATTVTGKLHPALVHGLKWSLFVVPLAYLGFAQLSGSIPPLEQTRNLIEVAPHSYHAQVRRATVLEEQGQLDHALAYFQQAVQNQPSIREGQVGLGRTLEAKGRLHEAIHHYREAAKVDPRTPQTQIHLGYALQRVGAPGEAELHFRRAVELDADSPDALYGLGFVLALQGRLDEASRTYERVVEIAPDHADAHYNLGLLRSAAGDESAAIEHLQAALRIQPESSLALVPLAWVLATHSDPEERDLAAAVALGELAVDRTARQDLSALSTLAAVQAEAGRFDEAVRTAREALTLPGARGDPRLGYIEQQVADYRDGRTGSPISRQGEVQ